MTLSRPGDYLPEISHDLDSKLKNLELLALDVDGVLTDCSIFIDDNGRGLKRFHGLDGHGIKMLSHGGVKIALISGRECTATRQRAKELGITDIHMAIDDKAAAITNLTRDLGIDLKNTAFAGDDLIDWPAIQLCGISFAPANAIGFLKDKVSYVCKAKGGEGAVREICDLVLRAKSLSGY